jgi:C1A family cysteine protease
MDTFRKIKDHITILRYALCVFIAATTVGEVCAQGVAPLNPAFLSWQKKRRIAKPTPNPALTNAQSRLKMLNASSTTAPDETLDFGLIPETFDSSYLANLNLGLDCGVQDTLPSKYDMRTIGLLTPVKNQNPYGTCWAHATLGALESGLRKSESATYDFSENNMVNLHGWDWGFSEGGNATISSAYLLRWDGPVLESSDPYPNPGESILKTPVCHIQRVRWIPGRSYYFDLDNIKKALMDCGALHVSYLHDGYFYNSAKSSYYNFSVEKNNCGNRLTNHAVALVGWDDGYSKLNFKSPPPGDGAFIVRNSWGSPWGEDGYFYVSYYDESFA